MSTRHFRLSGILVSMAIERIGTADNREAWLEQRKRYLTASAVFGWRGPHVHDPKVTKKYEWYWGDNNRESILREKLEGWEKEFPFPSEVSMAHGREDEEHIIWKVGELLGCHTENDNSMFVNSRWPCVAATIDAFIHPYRGRDGSHPFCQSPELVRAAQSRLQTLPDGRATVLEIKKSISVGWARDEVPEYYVAQVQTQLHVLDLPFGIIAAECIFPDPAEKWRKYWDLRPFVIERDPAWASVLDSCNAEFAELTGQPAEGTGPV